MRRNRSVFVACCFCISALVASPVFAEGQSAKAEALRIIKMSRAVVEGEVIAISEEIDQFGELNEVSTILLTEIISGYIEGDTVIVQTPLYGIPDLLLGLPRFNKGDDVIVCLAWDGQDLIPLLKFRIDNDVVENSEMSVSQFKGKIKNIANRGIVESEIPLPSDSQGGFWISKLDGEFSTIASGMDGPFKGTTILLKINPSGALDKDGNQLSFADVKTAVERAVSTWNNSSHSYATLAVSSTEYTGSRVNNNDVSTVTFEPMSWNGAANVFPYGGIIDEIDVRFDSNNR